MAKVETYKDGVLVSVRDRRTLKDAIAEGLEIIRGLTSSTINSAGLDEKTQLNAIAGIYPPERCEAIKSYIAACRNEYLRCKALILAATTNDECDAVQFVAPSVPENL